MDRVIGGEFAIDPVAAARGLRSAMSGKESLHGICKGSAAYTKYYASGRTALFAILQSVRRTQTGKILIPNFLCETITRIVIASGMAYDFYHVDKSLLPDERSLKKIGKPCAAILLINYFGMLDLKNTVETIRSIIPAVTIIIDDVQNLYSFAKELDYDYAFTSFRKWLPVPDGAAVCTKDEKSFASLNEYADSNAFAQYKFAGNLLKSYASFVDERIILDLIKRGESKLDENYLCNMSRISMGLLQDVDMNSIALSRRQNAAELHKRLVDSGISHIYSEGAVPLFVPAFLNTEKRTAVRKSLFAKNIFCPIHWPWKGKIVSGENTLYDTELSLICDQRYTMDDMRRIVETFNEYQDN